MLRVAALALVLCGLAAAFCLVPVRGRTALARFEAAPDAGTFFSRAWDEWRGAPSEVPARPPRAKAAQRARPSPPAPPAARRAQAPEGEEDAPRGEPAAPARGQRTAPTERHSASDRAALDRLLSERSR
jgi:hypothetical protein